jgi:acetyl-CoA carboxylase carboxyltransferase component
MSALAERVSTPAPPRVVEEEAPRTLGAYERLEALCDPGSLHVIRSNVLPRRESRRMRPGDGVVGAAGSVAGRPVYCYAQDQTFAGGSLGEAHAETIVRVMRLAGRAGAPVVGFVASGGARMDDGIAAATGGSSARRSRCLGACRRSPSSPACPRAAAPIRPRSPTSWS